MDVNEIAKLLPEKPRPGMVEEILKHNKYSSLGGEFIVFKRESITIEPDLKRTMLPSDFEEHERKTIRRWAAECRCTACHETFIAGYENKNGLPGIKLFQGEDGQLPYRRKPQCGRHPHGFPDPQAHWPGYRRGL